MQKPIEMCICFFSIVFMDSGSRSNGDNLLVLRAERGRLESAEQRDHRKGRGGCRTGLCLPARTRAADALRRCAVRGSQVRTLQRIRAPGLPAAAALRQLCPAARRPCGLALRDGICRDGRAAPVVRRGAIRHVAGRLPGQFRRPCRRAARHRHTRPNCL